MQGGIDFMVYISVMALTLVVFGVIGFYYYRKKCPKVQKVVRRPAPVVQGDAGAAGGAMRRRVAAAQRVNRLQARMEAEGVDSDLDGSSDEDAAASKGKKVGVKKQRKLDEKAERKTQREAEERERLERKKLDAEKDKEKKMEDEREALEEADRLERERLQREEEERREEEEYQKMRAEFVIEDEGEDGLVDEAKTRAAIRDFIDYIEKTKVVMVEDLAERFNLKTKDCIERVKSLQESGDLSGVMDDRGKFIHISLEEYEQVAKFIRQRGRVTIKEIAENSNKFIKLGKSV